MINHARTLLMNTAGIPYFPDTPGEELVPTLYQPIVLPSSLTSVRRLLFGADPDRHMLNYRVRQLMGLIHSCELAEFVTDLDPRITYDFKDEPYFDPAMFKVFGVKLVVPSGAMTDIYLFGDAYAPDRSGKMYRVWDIELINNTTAHVRLRGQSELFVQTYSVSGGLSSRLPLPGSGFEYQVRDSVFTASQGPKFRVESVSRPQTPLGDLMASVGLLGDETLAALFGTITPAGSQEPLKTFRRLYEEHYSVAHRLGAVVLALIYQTEARRIA